MAESFSKNCYTLQVGQGKGRRWLVGGGGGVVEGLIRGGDFLIFGVTKLVNVVCTWRKRFLSTYYMIRYH